ncbi:hypothetical protein HDU93_009409, partial [Gonapodya sp. JEL0774]
AVPTTSVVISRPSTSSSADSSPSDAASVNAGLNTATSSPSASNTPAIIGGVAGAAAFLALIAAVVPILIRRSRRRKDGRVSSSDYPHSPAMSQLDRSNLWAQTPTSTVSPNTPVGLWPKANSGSGTSGATAHDPQSPVSAGGWTTASSSLGSVNSDVMMSPPSARAGRGDQGFGFDDGRDHWNSTTSYSGPASASLGLGTQAQMSTIPTKGGARSKSSPTSTPGRGTSAVRQTGSVTSLTLGEEFSDANISKMLRLPTPEPGEDPPTEIHDTYVAKKAYRAQMPDELSVEPGDRVFVDVLMPDQWATGKNLRTALIGFVPMVVLFKESNGSP